MDDLVLGGTRVNHQLVWRRARGSKDQHDVLCVCGLHLGWMRIGGRVTVPLARARALGWLAAHLRDVDYGAPCGRSGCSKRVTDHHLGLCGEHARVAYGQVGRGKLRW
jgi:hypothetical protein